ncbi:MAG: very short patch repair endonuclease [Candidatus Thalassarchaeaceae archaeon]|jgi:DNA mismatch endonuclease (patch repair protein)|nr:very short patch repair endonuclease [Candidatus Thalassarchaeaceae archaeon]
MKSLYAYFANGLSTMALEVPVASSPAVHNVMVANKSTNTKPELVVRGAIREAGFPGYRLHWRIDDSDGKYICRPDITFPGRKLAIFVHGCFWHRCSRCKLNLPKTNTDYWSEKFNRNEERDRRKERSLGEMGWTVRTIWECNLGGGASEVVEFLEKLENRP